MITFTKCLIFVICLSLTLLVLTNSATWSGELHTSVVTYTPGPSSEGVPIKAAECIITNVGKKSNEVTVTGTAAPITVPFPDYISSISTFTLQPGEVSFVAVDLFPDVEALAYCSFAFTGENDSMRGIIRMVDRSSGQIVVLERAEAR
jgi:hypothetical protein